MYTVRKVNNTEVPDLFSNNKIMYFIDLFCGCGGVTTGLHNAFHHNKKIVKVIACVNHDENAIKSHYMNYPETVHYTEDIRTLDISGIAKQVAEVRRLDPDGIICLWVSAECTNHSNAKGGGKKNADSRTLYRDIYRYVEVINPDYVFNENVREIMKDGPLDAKGNPIKKLEGTFFNDWVDHIKGYGYEYDYRILNSADYGAYTSRVRYFSLFAKPGFPIVFPASVYAKKPESGKKRWKPVKEVLDLSDSGESIFDRKKVLCDKTLTRIYGGLIKHIAGGIEAYEKQYKKGASINKDRVTDDSYWMIKYYSSGANNPGVDEPLGTITTKDRFSLCKAEHFVSRPFSNGDNTSSIEQPTGSITTIPKLDLVSIKNRKWIMNTNFNNIGSSIEEPAPVITANRKHHYIMNPQWFNKTGGTSVDNPCPTLIARQDKAPLYLITADHAKVAICVYPEDSEILVKIKEFMVLYDIVDIKMRMLKILELLKIQGFPDGYKLTGTKTQMKKYIGNSVTPIVPESWVESIYEQIMRAA